MRIIKLVIVLWVMVYFYAYFRVADIYYLHYKYVVLKPWDLRMRMDASLSVDNMDFYDVMQFCKTIPENEKIRFDFSSNPRVKAFLEGKGRYHLYPRNYGENDFSANFILVYLNPQAHVPQDFEPCVHFGKDKTLFIKTEHPLKAKICHENSI
jgi:hypothetical protein